MLILDNADDLDLDLSPHFPLGDRGTILITSRNPECRIHATAGVCELGRMEEEEAITLMLKTVGHEDVSDEAAREVTKSVVSILGCLALAIDQAGAVIRQGFYTIEEYRKVYSRRRKELLNQKSVQRGGDYEHTVYTSWDISLRMIKNKGGRRHEMQSSCYRSSAFSIMMEYQKRSFAGRGKIYREAGVRSGCVQIN
jgi:hypothetical protein